MEEIIAQVKANDTNLSIALGFAAFGLWTASCAAFGAVRSVAKYLLWPRMNLKARYGGGWALVTGASDGLGKQYSLELAKAGFNLILVGRNAAKLEQAQIEIMAKNRAVQVITLVFDFSTLCTQESVQALETLLANGVGGKDVSVLVNNVGCAFFGKFGDHSVWDAMRQINVNINSQTYMTRAMLPKLLARDSRSAVIDISSVCALQQGCAQLPIYAATKAFNLAFSQSNRKAYSDKIDFLTVTPDSVKTQMNSGRYAFSVYADSHARQVINQLGRQSQTYGHWLHAAKPWLMSCPLVSFPIDTINARRRQAWLDE